MKRVSRPFTLMEVSIAFALIAIIVGILMTSMRNSILLAEEMSSLRKTVLERHKCYARLTQVFARAQAKTLKVEEKALTFTFENGFDPEMEFSGPAVEAKLAIDEGENLLLTLSSKESAKERLEYLFPYTQGIAFEKAAEDILLITVTDRSAKEIVFPCFLKPSDTNSSKKGAVGLQ